MVLGTIGSLASDVSMSLVSFLIGRMADAFGEAADIHDVIRRVSLHFVYLAIDAGVESFLHVTCRMVTGERQAARIRNLYLKSILRQEIGFFDQGDVHGGSHGQDVSKFIHLVSTFVGGFVTAFARPGSSPSSCCLPSPLFVAGAAMSTLFVRMASRGQTAYAETSVIVKQTIGIIRTVVSFTGDNLALEKYAKSFRASYKASCQETLAAAAGIGTVLGIIIFGFALGIWYGSRLILDKGYSGGDVFSVILSILFASLSLGQTSPCISAFAAGKAAGFKMFETIEKKPEIDAYDEAGGPPGGDAELRDPHFSYPARPEEPVFTGLSLVIPTGTATALVAQSGSGKSTSGAVLIDGVDLRVLHLRWIRGKIGLHPGQHRLRQRRATVEEVRAASELANATKFLDKIPQGSAGRSCPGEKQRVAIARAILKNPCILLLDEATSALDAESEHIVEEALDRVMKDRTTVIVAHLLEHPRSDAPSTRDPRWENSSRHSSVAFVMSAEIGIYDVEAAPGMEESPAELEGELSWAAREPPSVSRLAAMNKPEIPVLLLGQSPRRWPASSCRCSAFLLGLIQARSYFFAVAGARLVKRIRMRTFEKVLNMEMAWFDEPQTRAALVGDALAMVVQNFAAMLAGLIIAFVASWQLSLIVLMMYEEASQVADDALGSIRTVASFSAEDKVMELYKNKSEGPVNAGWQDLISGIGFGISFFCSSTSYATTSTRAKFVEDGKTTILGVFQSWRDRLSQSSGMAPDSSKARSAIASVFAILDRKPKIEPSDLSGKTPEVKGKIPFRHVSVRYPMRPEVQIFQDLCLIIHAGKTVALVGESGCGKSTAIALLHRFYDPDLGQIMLDGEDIWSFQLRWLRWLWRQMGLVSQEPVLFNDSIRANIAYCKDGGASEAEIVAAAEAANAHKLISSLQQVDPPITRRGTRRWSVSRKSTCRGGQKQRVAIARAIVKDPRIVLLDAATSALDAESERVVQDALDRLIVNRTTVIVAHRLSTIKGADLIAIVKNGA
ncbi:unnamed protein product [Spirodela intermedia]|uniref:Uncharacterized protein n=1 Tax=Spirodela intermedia TaxID=51605 RepID=A0A7I8JGD2_SPIIN|nr:unnamed protein product [Spirodela intermedia]CAA6668815.1 unnamed protein product [Spirodela intermedia]